MPVRHTYKPGSWNRICDLSGFTVRAERTRKQWNNYIVRDDFFENRNAQDFVRGRRDEQASPDPRPRQLPFVFEGGNTTLSITAAVFSVNISLTASIGLVAGNIISILLDNGNIFYDTVVSASGDFNPDFSPDFSQGNLVVLSKPLPGQASAGNIVVNTDFVAVQQQNYPRAS